MTGWGAEIADDPPLIADIESQNRWPQMIEKNEVSLSTLVFFITRR
jgi:hypothetical protein